MRSKAFIRGSSDGMTLIELLLTITILCILMAVIGASYETIKARIRYSSVKANMDSIAQAGYIDYTNNLGVWDFALNPWTPPPSIMGNNLLRSWPQAPCPGWYFSWDNGQPFGLDVVRVSVRRADDSAAFSYCVNTYGGGNCNQADIYSGAPTVEISTADISHINCNE